MRALVLGGAGAVCKETTRDLALTSNFEEIAVADSNPAAVERLLAEIGNRRLKPLAFDAGDYDAMLRLFPQYDLVVNGLPFQYDLVVNRACVEAGVNGLDLSSLEEQFGMDAAASAKQMIFVPGVGATPGVTNLMVAKAAEQLDRLETVEIAFAAFRSLAPAPGLLTTTLWEFDPEEAARQQAVYEDGAWHYSPPLSGAKRFPFHELIGEQATYFVPHDEVFTLPRSYPSLQRVSVRGCFPPRVMELMSSLLHNGILGLDTIQLDGREVPALEAVRALLWQNPVSKLNPVWAYGLVVEVTGEKAGRRLLHRYRNHHPPQQEWGGEAAYYKNVGLPLSIGAQLIARGEVNGHGVLPPERAFRVDSFFQALAERGIRIEETVEELAP